MRKFDEDEINDIKLKEGDCDGVILSAKINKRENNEFETLLINSRIWDKEGKDDQITTFVDLSDKWRWKLKQIFESIGKLDFLKNDFESKDIPTQLINCNFKGVLGKYTTKTGQVRLGINNFLDPAYQKKENSTKSINKSTEMEYKDNFFNDDIPFGK